MSNGGVSGLDRVYVQVSGAPISGVQCDIEPEQGKIQRGWGICLSCTYNIRNSKMRCAELTNIVIAQAGAIVCLHWNLVLDCAYMKS
jgi:hypothetical protein